MYSTRALPCRVNTQSTPPSPAADGGGELDEDRHGRASRGGERVDRVVVAPRRATRHPGLCPAAMDPFFGLDRARITETHLLHRCAEDAVDKRSCEATEGDRDCPPGCMTRHAGERGGCESSNERGANRGRRE